MTRRTQPDHLLIRTIRGEMVQRPPVWAMRQAGRWDPEFNRLRGKLSFYEFSENAELSAQASLLPVRFGVDAVILFYDITTLAVAMGLRFELVRNRGPVPKPAIRNREDVSRLTAEPDPNRFAHVLDILGRVRKELAGSLPILVFAGAPFTLASYCIATGKDVAATRRFIAENPAAWEALVEVLTRATVHFLRTLAEAGADAFQLFDSWAGKLTSEEFQRWAVPYHRAIVGSDLTIPSILFVKECPYVEAMLASGADVISLGTGHDLASLRQRHRDATFQGNVSAELLRRGTPEQVAEATRRCIAAGGGHRHIVNLNHGVDRHTPVDNFAAFVQTVINSRGPSTTAL